MPRVLLILPSATYRAPAFLEAAARLGVDVVCASDRPSALAGTMGDHSIELDLDDPDESARRIVELDRRLPLDAVVGVDDQGVLTAAVASGRLGLRTNPAAAVAATRDKVAMRALLAAGEVDQPRHGVVRRDGPDPEQAMLDALSSIGFPAVLKPSNQSASRGVIRVDDPDQARAALRRIDAMLLADGDGSASVLVESFVPGDEIAVEAILHHGTLTLLAVFDKPDPLDGPFFEETIYVTPSRHERSLLADSVAQVAAACRAMGLEEGPVHAELRLTETPTAPEARRPVLLEVAARTIGGRCAAALSFARGESLESIVLAGALGLEGPPPGRLIGKASGVMMLPVPARGILRRVRGTEAALATPGITGVEVSIPVGHFVEMAPENSRYLGFVFAAGDSPEQVVSSLRQAHAELAFEIEGVEDSRPVPEAAGAAR